MLRTLLTLAWPIMVSRSTQAVVTICDALMVSHLGPSAIGAASAGGFNTVTFLIPAMGIMFIVSSFASQYFGQGDLAGARRYGWYGLGVALVTQLIVLAFLPFLPQVLAHFSYTDDVRTLMVSYMQIRLLSVGAATGLEALGNYYGGIGNTRLPMVASVFAMSINVLLCWLFINGQWGAPALGVRGAAIGNVIATSLAFLFLFGRFWFERVPRVQLQWHELWRLLRFGIPSGLNWLFEFLAFSFFINVVVTSLGTSSLAAMMSVFDMNTVAFMPAFGLASAGAILVGQQIGAKRLDDVPRTVAMTLRTTIAWQGTAGLIYIFAPQFLLGFFTNNDADMREFVAVGTRTLFMAGLWQVADATLTTYAESLRAAGDTTYAMVARLIVAWAIFVPGVLITVRLAPGNDVAASVWVIVYLGLVAAALAVRFHRGAWRSLDLTGATSVTANLQDSEVKPSIMAP